MAHAHGSIEQLRSRRDFLGLLGLGGAAVAVGCTPPAASAPPRAAPAVVDAALAATATPPAAPLVVRLSTNSHTAGNWPDYVATQKGWWAANGLDADIMVAGTTVASVQALASGSTDISYITADSAIAAVEKGAELVAIWGGQNRPIYSLIVQPQITSYEQLRGGTIGVSALSSGDAFFVQRMMERAGLKAQQDYDVIPAGGTPERYAALKNGAIAGALLVQPFDDRIVRDGFRRLALSTEAVAAYSWNALWVRRAWAQANEEAVLRTLRTLRQAHQWLYDPGNRDEAVEILAAELKAEPDEARDAYAVMVQQGRAWSTAGEIPDEAMQAPIDFLAGRGELASPLPTPAKYVDRTYLQKLGG